MSCIYTSVYMFIHIYVARKEIMLVAGQFVNIAITVLNMQSRAAVEVDVNGGPASLLHVCTGRQRGGRRARDSHGTGIERPSHIQNAHVET